jgi:hypothetical protein
LGNAVDGSGFALRDDDMSRREKRNDEIGPTRFESRKRKFETESVRKS